MRVLLDTNVISELQRPAASPRVVERLREFDPGDLFISVVTVGEIANGISLLAAGTKRRAYEAFLSLDLETCRIWGEITAAGSAKGRKIPAVDGFIAATALRHGMHLMTRNTKDFAAAGVLLVNPWEE